MNLSFRKIRDNDNLKEIFILIYTGDPYIYHDLFGEIEDGFLVYQKLINNPNSVFYREYYRVVENLNNPGEIVGVCTFFDRDVKWNPNIMKNAYVEAMIKLPDSFDAVSNYMVSSYNYPKHSVGVCNISVKEKYRNQKIGTFILEQLMQSFDDDIKLTVLKDNIPAIKLYSKFGFKIIDEFMDYGGYNLPKVSCYTMYYKGE